MPFYESLVHRLRRVMSKNYFCLTALITGRRTQQMKSNWRLNRLTLRGRDEAMNVGDAACSEVGHHYLKGQNAN